MAMENGSERTPLLARETKYKAAPWGVGWRSSSWYITITVGVAVATDMLCYMIVVPILPFRLQALGYSDISQHVSWLMFAYSCGIITCIFPVAFFFHRNPWRREPMLAAVIVLQLALVLFMQVEVFTAMVVARFLQGGASSVVFSVGMALICENVPRKHIGRQIGWGLSGAPIGSLLAPPIGGALYARFGWNAPFLFCLALCGFDLLARLFVIEQRDLPKYGLPMAINQVDSDDEEEAPVADVTNLENGNEELSLIGVVKALATNRRGMTGFMGTAFYGLIDGALDPTLTLRVSEVWHKNSQDIGMIYLIAAVPCFFTGPLFGHLADKYGSEFVMTPMFAAVLPWLFLLLSDKNLPLFVAYYAITTFCLNGAVAPNGHEVAMGARETKGISEIHQFAAMNLAYALSSAFGAVAGGQMYDRTPQGWNSVIWFCFAACAAAIPITGMLAGDTPLFWRLGIWRNKFREQKDDALEE